jgi:Putative Ig domain
MNRSVARGLPRTGVRVALIVAVFSLLVPAIGEAAAVTLDWDRNADSVTAGYYVYYGTASGNYSGTVDVGSSTTAVVNLNDPNATYYFAVQAYSATGERSPISAEIVLSQNATPVGGTPSGSPALLNPGSMTTLVGQSVNVQLSASDPSGLALSYSVSGLPPGLALGAGTGVIFGIPNTPGAYNVTITVRNTSSLPASQIFMWTVLSQPSSTAPGGGLPGSGGGSGTGGGGSGTGGGGSGTGGGSTISDGSGFIGGTPTGGGTPGSSGPAPSVPAPMPAPDVTSPSVIVNTPVGGSWRTINSRVILTGIASDNVGVVSVTWANSRGGSGSALGTSSWATGPIELQMGDNVITITAVDAAGNVRTVTLTVTRYADLENHLN